VVLASLAKRRIAANTAAMPNTNRIFGRRLRVIRRSRQWTLEQLGRKARLGYKHVADIERGVKAPSFEAIDRLAHALGVEPYELFLPTPEPGFDTEMRFGDLLKEFKQIGSPAMKRFVIDTLHGARNLHAALSGSGERKTRRAK